MSGAWRAAGLTYIEYSNVAAQFLRRAIKPELRAEAAKRSTAHVKFTQWTNGKPARKATTETPAA